MSKTDKASLATRWAIPVVAAVAGVAYLVAGLAGGDVSFGVFGLVLMLGVAAAFMLLARRSETAAGLRDRTDERINAIDRSASLVAGMTVLLAALLMFVVEIAQGKDGSPYYQLGALGGITYLLTLVWLRYRR